MRNKINILMILSCMVLFQACTKSDSTSSTSSNVLNGTWHWVSTDGGIGNNIHLTPASTGDSITLVINNNQYVEQKNGILISNGTFSISSQNCIHTATSKSWLDFSDPAMQDMMVENMTVLELVLSDENVDGLATTFKK